MSCWLLMLLLQTHFANSFSDCVNIVSNTKAFFLWVPQCCVLFIVILCCFNVHSVLCCLLSHLMRLFLPFLYATMCQTTTSKMYKYTTTQWYLHAPLSEAAMFHSCAFLQNRPEKFLYDHSGQCFTQTHSILVWLKS